MTERAHPLDSVAPNDLHMAAVAAILRGEVSAESFDCEILAATIDRARQLARQMREGEPVAWMVEYEEVDGTWQTETEPFYHREDAEVDAETYTDYRGEKGARVVPLYALPLAPEGAAPTEDA